MLPAPQRKSFKQFRVNLDPGRSGTNDGDVGAMFCLIKQTLKELDVPWKVVASSNGRFMGLGGLDCIENAADVQGGIVGAPHTWVLMTHPGLPGQFCFDFDSASTMFMTVTWSPGSIFLGGNEVIRPGAADEQVLATRAPWLGEWRGRDGVPMRAHVIATEDATRVVCATQNRVRSVMLFEVPTGATSGWIDPSVSLVSAPRGDAEAGTYDALWDGAPAQARGPIGAMSLALTCEGYVPRDGEVVVIGRDHTMPSEHGYEIVPIGLWHGEVVGQRGHHGFLTDVWWTSAALSSGATFPSDGTKQFVVFGDMLFPWNGSRVELG